MGFNSAFKGLTAKLLEYLVTEYTFLQRFICCPLYLFH